MQVEKTFNHSGQDYTVKGDFDYDGESWTFRGVVTTEVLIEDEYTDVETDRFSGNELAAFLQLEPDFEIDLYDYKNDR